MSFRYLFEDALGDLWFPSRGDSPRGEISEGEDGLLMVMLDLPGGRREDFKVKVKGGRLLIEGEWRGRDIRRVYSLGREIDRGSVRAEMSDGVLRVTMGRKSPPAMEEREIQVE
jgi:HSP20 family molecular chaperone IbpA